MRIFEHNGHAYTLDDSAGESFGVCYAGEMAWHFVFHHAEVAVPAAEVEVPVADPRPVAIRLLDGFPCEQDDPYSPIYDGFCIGRDEYVLCVMPRFSGKPEELNGDIMTGWEYAVKLSDAPNAAGKRPVYEVCWQGQLDYDAATICTT